MTFLGKIALATALLAAPAYAQINVEAMVDEGSTVKSQLTFKNTHGSSITPDSATYEWRSVATDIVLIPETTIPIAGSTATVLSPPMFIPTDELIANNPNAPDKITVVQVLKYTWDGGAGHKDKAIYVYLRNVPGVAAP
jgi:hypothetical protein